MVANITQKSSNALENQGDKSLEKGKSSDASLFDQFSEILDKIATSLNHVKQKRDSQSLKDLSDSLSQAAAQQMTQRAPIVERKIAAEVSARPVVEAPSRGEATPVAKEAPKTDAPQVNSETKSQDYSADAKDTASKTDVAESTKSEAASAEVTSAETGQAVKQAVTAQAQTTPVTDTETPEAQLDTQDAPVVSTDEAAQFVSTEDASTEDTAPEQVKAAPAPAEKQSVQSQVQVTSPEAQVSESEQVVPVAAQQVSEKTQSTDQSHDEVEQAPVVESKTSAADSAVRISLPQNEDFISVQPEAAKVDQTKEIDVRQLLLQSAQALINQALSLSPARQLLDASISQKLIMPGQAVQGITPGAANGQSVASPLLQNRFTQSAPEKSAARELSRPQALRTMERVESALKEAARSKDGKTISLRLDPPSLGSVKIDLTLKDGQLHARFVAESPQVNALLRDQSHELQQILRRAGVQADRVTVSIAGEAPIDLNQNFQSFDQKGTQQFSESSRVSGDFGAGIEVGADTAAAVAATVQPTDHWVA